MANVKKDVVTKEYYDKLQAEYRNLIDVVRPQVISELAIARAQGDLSENADYDAARQKQAEVEARIRDLEATLTNIEVADGKAATNKVNPTSKVTIYDEQDDCEYTYQIVGSIGSDPEDWKISTECALGSALLGKKVNDEVDVVCGDGSIYKVIIKKIS